jgi:perosamine synthetase
VDLRDYLSEKKIQTREFFYPLNLQPCYNNEDTGDFTTSHYLFERGLSLPSSYGLSTIEQERVIEAVKDFYKCGN